MLLATGIFVSVADIFTSLLNLFGPSESAWRGVERFSQLDLLDPVCDRGFPGVLHPADEGGWSAIGTRQSREGPNARCGVTGLASDLAKSGST